MVKVLVRVKVIRVHKRQNHLSIKHLRMLEKRVMNLVKLATSKLLRKISQCICLKCSRIFLPNRWIKEPVADHLVVDNLGIKRWTTPSNSDLVHLNQLYLIELQLDNRNTYHHQDLTLQLFFELANRKIVPKFRNNGNPVKMQKCQPETQIAATNKWLVSQLTMKSGVMNHLKSETSKWCNQNTNQRSVPSIHDNQVFKLITWIEMKWTSQDFQFQTSATSKMQQLSPDNKELWELVLRILSSLIKWERLSYHLNHWYRIRSQWLNSHV